MIPFPASSTARRPNGRTSQFDTFSPIPPGFTTNTELFHGWELVDYKVADLWDHARKQPLESPPGTRAKYCNLGYFVLTRIIERAAGVPYVRYMQDHVLARAGMKDASYADKEVVVPRRY